MLCGAERFVWKLITYYKSLNQQGLQRHGGVGCRVKPTNHTELLSFLLFIFSPCCCSVCPELLPLSELFFIHLDI